jgi:hypothetical protein
MQADFERLSRTGDNRFMPGFTLDYRDLTGEWRKTT